MDREEKIIHEMECAKQRIERNSKRLKQNGMVCKILSVCFYASIVSAGLWFCVGIIIGSGYLLIFGISAFSGLFLRIFLIYYQDSVSYSKWAMKTDNEYVEGYQRWLQGNLCGYDDFMERIRERLF